MNELMIEILRLSMEINEGGHHRTILTFSSSVLTGGTLVDVAVYKGKKGFDRIYPVELISNEAEAKKAIDFLKALIKEHSYESPTNPR
jgi:hypothetical protein